MEFAQTLLRLLRLLERLESCRTRRQFWYPTPGALWRHFRGTDREEGDKVDQNEQVNDGQWTWMPLDADWQLLSTTTRMNFLVR
jgi:hypothetical protein